MNYTNDYSDTNICRWNLNVHDCKDEDYYRAIYYNKLLIAIFVSILDSVLIIYRIGVKRRNIITPYGIASIDGLLIFVGLFAYAMIYHSITILKSTEVSNFIFQEFCFYLQYIFVLIAIQIYLTGTLNASPRYKGSSFYYPRPRVVNTISTLLLIFWLTVEIMGIYNIGSLRNFFFISGSEEKQKEDNVLNKYRSVYQRWIKITYITFGVASIITCILFMIFGINVYKAAKRSLEDMYRNKRIRSNIVIPIRIALYKMRWINGACYCFMFAFGAIFVVMGIFENEIYSSEGIIPKIFCIAMNLIPPAIVFMTLLSIVYGEARSDIIAVFPSNNSEEEEEEYPMNNTRPSHNSEENI